MTRRLFLFLWAVALVPAPALAQRPMSIVDLISVPVVSDPQLSPDGTVVVYVQADADWKANKRISHLWRARADGSGEAVQLTSGTEGESQPRWSPDSAFVAFVAKRDGAEHGQIQLLPTAGGEARRLTNHETAADNPAWSPDGHSIYFLAPDPKPAERVAGEKSKDSAWDSWRDRLDGLSLPLPSQFQLGIGLISGLLIVGTLMVRRYTSNPFMRALLKFVVVAVLGGTGYLLYFSNLNAEVSTLRNLPAPLSHDIDNSVLHPIQSVIEQFKDATVGKASRTVNQSNAVTTQMESTLKATEVDQAQVNGQ